ncbi:glycosyl transferase group 1 [Alkalidesulfovibrio alkalitolerans DSM 16529]|uniref:Glycosyl transferase group 1 n=1 Tax=Alkalidesulfovibrio alkalitolerans DSM 16529 TaxID=1121439 RepID=S7T1Q1_9BACT|nr:glycosyltransferase [Alkalidesulfovibrio alkalitolerans]EPR31002.1 glycosyl transferase group 1 [Alkalidesulfovibrio alkalitolerans DSM 16529]
MNVCFVNSTRRWGGVKTWTLDAAARLQAMGHGVSIVCREGTFADASAARGLNVSARRFGLDYSPLMIAFFLHHFKMHGVQVVVCNVGKDLRTAGVAARLAGLPVVHRVGLPRDMRDTLKVRLTHRFVRPRLLSPCEFIKNGMLAEVSFLAPEEITVIRTGKECAAAPPAPRDHDGPRRLVVTSQLNPDKGHADLLHALAALAGEGLDYRLDVVGEGSSEHALRELGRSLGIDDRLTFHGFQSNVRAFLERADVFVLPSRSEGLPNTLLEAMAFGLLPVARDVGGLREVWPTALAPFLADPKQGDSLRGDDLREPLRQALTCDPEKFAKHRLAAWRACRENFDLKTQSKRLADWLSQLAGQSAHKPKP